jgi:hypothetical protein
MFQAYNPCRRKIFTSHDSKESEFPPALSGYSVLATVERIFVTHEYLETEDLLQAKEASHTDVASKSYEENGQ